MNREEALAATNELLRNSCGTILVRMRGSEVIQKCKICDAEKITLVVMNSDAGDRRLFRSLRKFQNKHRHSKGSVG